MRNLKRRTLTLAIVFSCCTLFAVLFASQFYFVNPRLQPQDISFAHALIGTLAYSYMWGVLAFAVVPMARRFPIGQKSWAGLAVHVPFGAALSAIHVLIFSTLLWGMMQGPTASTGDHTSWWEVCSLQLISAGHSNLFIYAAILGVIHAFDYYRMYRERLVRTSRLEAQLANAQLAALRMQLHPHFLFNTLNAIATLTRENPKDAERMIVRLSELLRMVLDDVGLQETQLRDELDLLRKYLEIEQIRFGERLQVRHVVEPVVLDAWVPTLILQPLVENAIRHGVSKRTETCRVEIEAKREDDRLQLSVGDTGPGAGTDSQDGIGLSNTRARLEQLYGSDQEFVVHSKPERGFAVRLTIPYRTSPGVTGDARARDSLRGRDDRSDPLDSRRSGAVADYDRGREVV